MSINGMKGDVPLTVQVIFAGLVVIVVLYFVWQDVIVPSVRTYGNEHAQLTAQSIATAVNALSREEEGTFYRDLGLAWDISVFHDDGSAYISVSHGKFKSGDIILLYNVDDFTASGTGSIYVIKEPGKKARLTEKI